MGLRTSWGSTKLLPDTVRFRKKRKSARETNDTKVKVEVLFFLHSIDTRGQPSTRKRTRNGTPGGSAWGFASHAYLLVVVGTCPAARYDDLICQQSSVRHLLPRWSQRVRRE